MNDHTPTPEVAAFAARYPAGGQDELLGLYALADDLERRLALATAGRDAAQARFEAVAKTSADRGVETSELSDQLDDALARLATAREALRSIAEIEPAGDSAKLARLIAKESLR